MVAVFVGWERLEAGGDIAGGLDLGCGGIAIGVIDGEFGDLLAEDGVSDDGGGARKREKADLAAAPEEDAADGGKDDADEEEDGQDGLGGEDGLPGFEALLLEGGVWMAMLSALETGGVSSGRLTGRPARPFLAVFGGGVVVGVGLLACFPVQERHALRKFPPAQQEKSRTETTHCHPRTCAHRACTGIRRA